MILSGTENKRILQVKNEIYTFEMTEEEAAKEAVFDYIYSDCDYDYDARLFLLCSREKWYIYTKRRKKVTCSMKCYRAKIGQKMGNIMSLHTIHVM